MRVAALIAVIMSVAWPLAAADAQTSTAVLQAARIASPPTVNVTVAPAAVTLEIEASSTSGLSSVGFTLRSPSGHQTITGRQDLSSISPSPTSFDGLVQTVFGGGGLRAHGLNLYSEPGSWALSGVTVCDVFRLCQTTTGPALAGMVAPLTVSVANAGSPVTTLPRVVSASILTPVVQQTSPFPNAYQVPPFKLALQASDVAPGLVAAHATFSVPITSPFSVNFCTGHAVTELRAPAPGAPVTSLATTLANAGFACTNATDLVGTYRLIRLTLADEAGNVLDITAPAKLAALFPAGTTVTVRP